MKYVGLKGQKVIFIIGTAVAVKNIFFIFIFLFIILEKELSSDITKPNLHLPLAIINMES